MASPGEPRHRTGMPRGHLPDRRFERISRLSRGRQAALDYQQAPEFLSAPHQRPGIAARALEVTLLTGLGIGEVIARSSGRNRGRTSLSTDQQL
jgi:hypothetical protein